KAKRLNRFTDGIFYENRAYKLGQQVITDALWAGTGVAYRYVQDDRVRFERVIPSEMYVDELEGFYGCPRQIHRVKDVDKDLAIATYAEGKKNEALRDAIWNAKPMAPEGRTAGDAQSTANLVTIRDSYHLKSGPEAE